MFLSTVERLEVKIYLVKLQESADTFPLGFQQLQIYEAQRYTEEEKLLGLRKKEKVARSHQELIILYFGATIDTSLQEG